MKVVLYIFLFLAVWGCTRKAENTLPAIDMFAVSRSEIGVMWDNPYVCFEHFSACFLEDTKDCKSTDILHFAVDKDTMFLSCRGELRRYSKEGRLEYRFDLPKSYVTSFDLDTLSRSIYILDSLNSEIAGCRYGREELFRLKLPISCYSVHYAGGNKVLLTGALYRNRKPL